mgnify:CR=1 FL=1
MAKNKKAMTTDRRRNIQAEIVRLDTDRTALKSENGRLRDKCEWLTRDLARANEKLAALQA